MQCNITLSLLYDSVISTFQNPLEGFDMWMYLPYKSYDMHCQVNAVGLINNTVQIWQVQY